MFFQNSVIKKYLASQDAERVNQTWKTYQSYFLNPAVQANIRASKEEQFQEGFLRELFVRCFGYTLNPTPDYNLITEQKNETDAKKADGAILRDGKIIGVIELKNHKTTDLSQVERQAFGYKNQHKDTRYVVISNFEKLRFYIDNAVEHIEWNLFSLTKEQFRLLYFCLSWTSISADLPAQAKAESVSNEDEITQQLYKDYSAFKREIFADILKHNTMEDSSPAEALRLFKKTQKLLDRLLFIFFAEDSGLLPPNSMIEILNQWEQLREMDAYVPLYDRIKKYFGYMNTGWKGKHYEIFAYNGGLFKPDEVLDCLIISDDVLVRHTRRLADYDYASEVDVNILGHIFENSLSEIEEISSQISDGKLSSPMGGGREGASKRKRDGVFYTPQYITKYIVENTVGKLCAEKKAKLGIVEHVSERADNATFGNVAHYKKKQLERLQQYREWLLDIKICDPACGSGAFLNAALQFLMAEHRLIDEMEAKLTGSSIVFQNIENSILENNLYGVDINEESVEIAKLALWLRTAKPHRKLSSLNNNIKCGNSLISDPAIAGDKAFDWAKEFPQVFGSVSTPACDKDGSAPGFDVVIGNPPYVNVENIPIADKEYYKSAYQSFYKRSDLFSLFVEKGLTQLTHAKSNVAFIIPSIVLNNISYQPLRDLFLNNHWLKEVSYVGGAVFSDATVDTSILLFDKKGVEDITLRHAVKFFEPTIHTVPADYFKTFKNTISIGEENADTITDKLFLPEFETVDNCFTVFQGIVTGNNDAFIFETEEDALSKGIEKELLHTLCHGRDIGKWETKNLERKILYVDDNTNLSLYPNAYNWLSSFKEKQDARNAGKKTDLIVWDRLHRPRIKSELDTKEKILIQNTRNESLKTRIVATIDKEGVYSTQGINIIIPKKEGYSIYFLLAILNSKVINYLFSKKFLNLAIKAEYIKQLRFPKLSLSDQQPFIDLADRMLSLNKDLQQKRARFLRRLQDNLRSASTIARDNDNANNDNASKDACAPGCTPVRITTALESFDTLDFAGFIAELKKQKIHLSLAQQDEWEEYFNQYKAACTELTSAIAATDKEIDRLVYDLYGLTEEERDLVGRSPFAADR